MKIKIKDGSNGLPTLIETGAQVTVDLQQSYEELVIPLSTTGEKLLVRVNDGGFEVRYLNDSRPHFDETIQFKVGQITRMVKVD